MKLNKDIDNTLINIKNHLNKLNLFEPELIPDLFFTKGHIEYEITFDKIISGNAYHFASSFCVLAYEYYINDFYYLAGVKQTYSYARVGNKIVKKLRKRSNEKIEFENDCLLVVCFLKLHIANHDIID